MNAPVVLIAGVLTDADMPVRDLGAGLIVEGPGEGDGLIEALRRLTSSHY